jgi:hypothetical protein
VRIDKPAKTPRWTFKLARLFASPARREKLKELFSETGLNLLIHICMTSPAARTALPGKLFR